MDTVPAAAAREAVIKVAMSKTSREIREGLAMLINGTAGLRLHGQLRLDGRSLSTISGNLPDVLLSDIGLPGMDGIEGIRILKERHPALLVLMLSVYDDNERIFDALCAGACGYLLKKTPPARLIESLREATAGGAPMSPEIARKVVSFSAIFVARRAITTDPARTRLLKFSSKPQL